MINKVKLDEKDVITRINKLIRNINTLDSVNVTKKSTSHYNFGTEEPFVKDRFDIQIRLGANKVIDCQVIFDSTDYNFPPDILFRKPLSSSNAFQTNEISDLLPDTWDINNENCLRDWFSRLLSLVKKSKSPSPPPPSSVSKSRTWSVFGDDSYSEKQAANDNDDYDDFMFEKEDKRKSRDDNVIRQKKATGKQKEDDDGTQMIEETIIWNDIKEKKDQKRKWDGLFERGDKKKETIDIVDEEDDVFDYNTLQYKDKKPKLSSQTKAKDYDDFEFAPPNKVRKLNHDSNASKVDSKPKDDPPVTNTKASFKQNNPKKREWRKEFMTAWLKKFQYHIIQYDTEDFTSFSLYLTFDISEQSSLWRKYNRLKHNKLVEFNTYNESNVKLCKAKPYAPMICHFNMGLDFPTSKLKVKLISVMNTTDVGSAEPDCLNVDYEVDMTKNIPSLIKDICKYLTDQAIPFHLQMD